MEKKPLATIVRIEDPPTKSLPERQHGGPQSGLPPPFIVGSELAPYLIVGMDFGVNYCRVSTFANGLPQHLKPHEYRALVEDALGILTTEDQLVHSIKHCLAGDYIAKKGDQFYSCEDIASAFLSGIKGRVEHAAERLMAKAVFSVPSCFTHAQRQTLIQAAAKAEIAVLGLINEPTAAALDACYRNDLPNGKYLVISIGSYSFEASVIDLQNRLIEVKAIRAAQRLSGRATTLALVHGFITDYEKGDPDELHVLLDRAKPTFEKQGAAVIEIAGERVEVSRAEATKWLQPFAEETEQLLNGLLSDSGTEPQEIAGIILSGAASQLWLLPDILKNVIDKHPVRGRQSRTIHIADVSAGAATFAALLVRQAKDWVVWDAIANPVLVAQGTHIRDVISVNSPLPINGHATLIPDEHGKTYATILQRTTDDENEIAQVATVTIMEEILSNDPSANVDLTIHATADGKLMFSARHTTLDVNLTVEVTEAVRERPVLEFLEPVFVDKGKTQNDALDNTHSCGIDLSHFDGKWIVRSVRDGSTASHLGVEAFDELLAINGVTTFELGLATQDDLLGKLGSKKYLVLSSGTKPYEVEVKCEVLVPTRNPNQMKLAIAEATISGDPYRLVLALLDYGNNCADKTNEQSYNEAQSALNRAAAIAKKELKSSDLLCIKAKCDLVMLQADRALCDMLQAEATLVAMRTSFEELIRSLKSNSSVPISAVILLYDVAIKLKELRAFNDTTPNIQRLFEQSQVIAANCRRPTPDYFTKQFRDLVEKCKNGPVLPEAPEQ